MGCLDRDRELRGGGSLSVDYRRRRFGQEGYARSLQRAEYEPTRLHRNGYCQVKATSSTGAVTRYICQEGEYGNGFAHGGLGA